MFQKIADAFIPDAAGLRTFWNRLAENAPDGQMHQMMYRTGEQQARFWFIVNKVKELTERYALRDGLEVGCAEGLMTAYLAKHLLHVDAQDLSDVMLSRAPKLPNVTYRQADIELTQIRPEPYDLIVISEVLEHLRDPRSVLVYLYRRCRFLIASCPITESPNPDTFNPDLLGRETKPGDAAGHIWSMDRTGFEELFAGLNVLEFVGVFHCGVAILENPDAHRLAQ